MPRPIHFEIHADDPDRAVAFYKGLFGWEFTKWEGPMEYWLVTTGKDPEPGIDGGLMKRMGPAPTDGQAVNAYVCTVGVENLDASIAKATGAGAVLTVPRMPVPGVGYLAYVKDSEGNLVGMLEPNEAAS